MPVRSILLGSIFRNSTRYLGRYFDQVNRLSAMLALSNMALRAVFVEGDSTDNTRERLEDFSRQSHVPTGVMVREHGGPMWGSVDVKDRWDALAWCCNGVMEEVTAFDDALIYVESDLIWEPQTLVSLLAHLYTVPAVAPMCFSTEGQFYDTYGHRKDGVCFSPFPPYHPALSAQGLTQIDSAGSCIVMRGELARVVRFGDGCVTGLGQSIYDNGGTLFVDPELKVVHP